MRQPPRIVWAPPEILQGTAGELQSRYLVRTLGLEVGSIIHLVCGDGYVYRARLKVADARQARLEVLDRQVTRTDPTVDVTLYMGALQGQQMIYVAQHATELGACRIVPMQTERSVRKLPFRGHARWQQAAWDSTVVSGRTHPVEVHPGMLFPDALSDASRDPVRILFRERHPELDSCQSLLRGHGGATSLFVGPEDGFTDEEISQAVGSGVALCTLGPRMLRGLTAAIAAVTVVLHELQQLR